jgi:hypothetical protein
MPARDLAFTVICGVVSLAAATAVAEPLRYRIEPGQVVPYSVIITAETPSVVDTMKGVFVLTGKKVEGEKMTVEYKGGLQRSVKSNSSGSRRGPFGRRPGGPPIPRGPFGQADFRGLTQSTSTLTVTSTGAVESMQGDSQLPYLLGNLSLFPFETLPEEEVNEWKGGTDLTVTSKSKSRFGLSRGPLSRGNDEKTSGGSESIRYRVNSRVANLLSIEKKYSLTAPAATSDDTGYEMSGAGLRFFDRQRGVSDAMNCEFELKLTTRSVTVNIPITVAWERMPDEEYKAYVKEREERMAALQKQAEERRAKQAAAAKERESKPLEEKVKKEVLADLNSSQWPTISRRLNRMRNFKPHPDDFDIALRIKELQSHKVIGVSLPAKNLWKKLAPIVEAAGESWKK